MTIERFVEYFDFELERDEEKECYLLIDRSISEIYTYNSIKQIVEQLRNSFGYEYVYEVLEEDGYYSNALDFKDMYEWCKKNKHPLKSICYAILHPETVED